MISVIKLISGLELLGEIVGDSGTHLKVRDPLLVTYYTRENSSTPSVTLQRYLPFSSSEDFLFSHAHVETIGLPVDGLQEYYDGALDTIKKHVDPNLVADLKNTNMPVRKGETSHDAYIAMMERVLGKKPLN